ncbi:hypothetical protein GCM10010872_40210 [Dyella flava]|nr:hypothetical protein GCM10010872_40210 [Dyella flava]
MKCLIVVGLVALAGCSATPTRPSNAPSIIYDKSEAVVQKAAVDALLANGFEIEKSDTDYVGGSRPHKVGLVVGSGGESAGVWLSPMGSSKTAVEVSTAKSLLGIVGQKNWDTEIIAEMDKSVGPHENGTQAPATTVVVPDTPEATPKPVPAADVASSARPQPPVETAAVATPPATASSPAPLANTAVTAQAQNVANQLGCGAIQAQGDSTFVAPCGSYSVLIDCYDDQCHAMHAVSVKSND